MKTRNLETKRSSTRLKRRKKEDEETMDEDTVEEQEVTEAEQSVEKTEEEKSQVAIPIQSKSKRVSTRPKRRLKKDKATDEDTVEEREVTETEQSVEKTEEQKQLDDNTFISAQSKFKRASTLQKRRKKETEEHERTAEQQQQQQQKPHRDTDSKKDKVKEVCIITPSAENHEYPLLNCSICHLHISGHRPTVLSHVISRHRNILRRRFKVCPLGEVVVGEEGLTMVIVNKDTDLTDDEKIVLVKEQLREMTKEKEKGGGRRECRACGYKSGARDVFLRHLLDHADCKLELLASKYVKTLKDERKKSDEVLVEQTDAEKVLKILQANVVVGGGGSGGSKSVFPADPLSPFPTGLLVRVERGVNFTSLRVVSSATGGGEKVFLTPTAQALTNNKQAVTRTSSDTDSCPEENEEETKKRESDAPVFILRCQNNQEKKQRVMIPSYAGKKPKVYCQEGRVQDLLSESDVLGTHSYSKAVFLASRPYQKREDNNDLKEEVEEEEEEERTTKVESRASRRWKSIRDPVGNALNMLLHCKPYWCKVCETDLSLATARKHLLDEHLSGKNVDITFDPLVLLCTAVPKTESVSSSLSRWTFGSPDRELFSCNHCQDCISLSKDEVRTHVVKEHLESLGPKEKFYCNKHCAYAGSSKAAWENHNKTCGRSSGVGVPTAGFVYKDRPIFGYNCLAVTMAKNMGAKCGTMCKICRELFECHGAVVKHLSEAHSFVQRGHACRRCDFRCRSERELKQHWQTLHALIPQQQQQQPFIFDPDWTPPLADGGGVKVCWVCRMKFVGDRDQSRKDSFLCRSKSCKETATSWRRAIAPAKKSPALPPLPAATWSLTPPMRHMVKDLPIPPPMVIAEHNIVTRTTKIDPWQNSRCCLCDYLPISVNDMMAHWQEHRETPLGRTTTTGDTVLVNVDDGVVVKQDEEDYGSEFDPLQITSEDVAMVDESGVKVEGSIKEEEVEEQDDIAEEEEEEIEQDCLDESLKLEVVQNCD